MPIYEYECEACGTTFEQLVRRSDPTPPCPDCGADEIQRLISNTSFQLKGSGWYVTDYKSPGKSSSTSSSRSTSSSASEASGSSSGESASDAGSAPSEDSSSKVA